ncbi:hypothetical protein [Plasmodium yoelii yoelii]|uniref:Uncharacterized protein n=1 Tax=Plasmodium yoelii yoelii TaxID=73239 RepID=Q7RM89_PLAYO|nr:hypothetical protein [Plasmodium yoelii yoelii]
MTMSLLGFCTILIFLNIFFYILLMQYNFVPSSSDYYHYLRAIPNLKFFFLRNLEQYIEESKKRVQHNNEEIQITDKKKTNSDFYDYKGFSDSNGQ